MWLIPMLDLLALVLEKVLRSAANHMLVYVRNILFAVAKDIEKMRHRKKDITMTGCDAHVHFSINKENVWTVQKVVVEHNHYLAGPNKTHKLRSQRGIIESDRKLIG
jgi:hypothetical protein